MTFSYSKIFLMLSLTSLLTGCFQQSSNSETTAMPSAQSDKVLRIAMMQPPRTGLSPLSDDAFKLSRWSVAETLVQLDPQGIAQPMLATEWQQLEPLVWQFKLRPQVQFHDGSALNAESVVQALNKALTAAPKPRILDGITWQVRAIEPMTVQITTEVADPLLPSRLSSPQLAILASKAYQADGRVSPLNTGTGPFMITEINGTTNAKLARFDHYWGEKAQIAEVIAEYVPDGFARAAALRTGQADIVEAIPVSQLAMIEPTLLHEVAMPRTNTLYLNNQSPVFKDIELRKTAAQAIDKQQIVSMVYEQRADLAQGLLGPALAWAAPLRQGFPQDRMRRRANGEQITIGTFTDRAELPEVAVLLKQQLENAGFQVTLDIREYAQIENDALAGKFDAFILSRATVLDSGDPVAYLQSDFGCQGSFNLGQFCSPEVDAALTHADLQPLGATRQQAIMAAEQLILQQYAAIPLLHERVIQGENLGVSQVLRDPRERQLITQFTMK